MRGRTPRLATGRAANVRCRRSGAWHVLLASSVSWIGRSGKSGDSEKSRATKKHPCGCLSASRPEAADQRDPEPSIAGGRRTRPALARWRFSKIRSGFRVMIVAGRVEEGAHSARGVAAASTRHGWDAASGSGTRTPRTRRGVRYNACGANGRQVSAASRRRTRRSTWWSSSCRAGIPSPRSRPCRAAACAGSRSSAADPVRSAGPRGGCR